MRRQGYDMGKTAVATDSNSGITEKEAKELGVSLVPMPFMIGSKTFYEGITLTQEEFYQKLAEGADISTSQPSPDAVTGLWKELLQHYEDIVYIPMSSGISGSCQTAHMLAQSFEGRVQVVNNQRISVTQRQSVLDALELVQGGKDAAAVRRILEADKFNCSIYIMLDTLYYLKKGGRITPAAAALGTFLKLKPVLQIQGERLDAFAKARTMAQGKQLMINAVKKDIQERFGGLTEPLGVWLQIAHANHAEAAAALKAELQEQFPAIEIYVAPLSLSVACHTGPGALGVACTQKLRADACQ